jgi:hypothetical protein
LHQHAVEPAAKFESDRIERSDQPEAGCFMQRDRGRVCRVANDGDHLSIAARFRLVDQSIKQQATQPAPLRAGRNVD